MVGNGGPCGCNDRGGVELILLLPCFSKLLTRHFQIGGFKRKTCFLQNNCKSLAKPHIELVALVILRVPPILTVALLNFYLT